MTMQRGCFSSPHCIMIILIMQIYLHPNKMVAIKNDNSPNTCRNILHASDEISGSNARQLVSLVYLLMRARPKSTYTC